MNRCCGVCLNNSTGARQSPRMSPCFGTLALSHCQAFQAAHAASDSSGLSLVAGFLRSYDFCSTSCYPVHNKWSNCIYILKFNCSSRETQFRPLCGTFLKEICGANKSESYFCIWHCGVSHRYWPSLTVFFLYLFKNFWELEVIEGTVCTVYLENHVTPLNDQNPRPLWLIYPASSSTAKEMFQFIPILRLSKLDLNELIQL